jgi:hypothetical protein
VVGKVLETVQYKFSMKPVPIQFSFQQEIAMGSS